MRTASRILLRIVTIRASNFRQLTRGTQIIEWDRYLNRAAPIAFQCATAKCRLYHTDAVIERIQTVIGQPDCAVNTAYGQTVYIRGFQDRFTISIDTSGELLHKRGIKINVGKAPLRETIAAASLLACNATPDDVLMDPMTGSGTFSIEMAMLTSGIPPGFFRPFAFETAPFFNAQEWDRLKQDARIRFHPPAAPTIFSSDIDFKACLTAKQNLAAVGLDAHVFITAHDFLDLNMSNRMGKKGIIAINFPFGNRVRSKSPPETFYRKILTILFGKFSNWRVILVAPEKQLFSLIPLKKTVIPLSHGGTPIELILFKVP